jgi:hypothetical protein
MKRNTFLISYIFIAFTGTNAFSSYKSPDSILGIDWSQAWGTGSDCLFGNLSTALGALQ